MNLASKIACLRRARGWSQEELAGRLGVSRQSVSKWESGASTPDLDRIVAMCGLFGLSADELIRPDVDLDDALSSAAPDAAPDGGEANARSALPELSLTEAYNYSSHCQSNARMIARGVAACILSPTALIALEAISDLLATAVGLPVLLVLVAWGVWQFVCAGALMKPFEFIEKRRFSPGPGVDEWANEAQNQFRPRLARDLAVGIALCVASAIPASVGSALAEYSAEITGASAGSAFLEGIGIAGTLVLVAVGVYLIVRSSILTESYKKLLRKRS